MNMLRALRDVLGTMVLIFIGGFTFLFPMALLVFLMWGMYRLFTVVF